MKVGETTSLWSSFLSKAVKQSPLKYRRAIDAKPPLKVFYLKISRAGEPFFRRRKVVKGSLTFRGHPWLSRDLAGLRIVRSIGKKF